MFENSRQVDTTDMCGRTGKIKSWRNILHSLKNEKNRLHTFGNWPVPFLQPEDLAKAGFFFLKREDHCRCVFCGGVVGSWEEGDQPAVEHKKHFPHCPFMNNLPVGNRTEEEADADIDELAFDQLNISEDECGRSMERRPYSRPERSSEVFQNIKCMAELPGSCEDWGIVKHTSPKHPHYETYEKRLETFREWPACLPVQPAELAEAGFYFVGVGDHVRCFYCSGGLRNWDATLHPWAEHARWFCRCPYVLRKKGIRYVKEILANYPPLLDQNANVPATNGQSKSEAPGSSEETCASVSGNGESRSSEELSAEETRGTTERPVQKQSVVEPTNSKEENVSDESKGSKTEENKLCRVCLDEEISTAFIPCGHLCGERCTQNLVNCHICRTPIKATIRIYMP